MKTIGTAKKLLSAADVAGEAELEGCVIALKYFWDMFWKLDKETQDGKWLEPLLHRASHIEEAFFEKTSVYWEDWKPGIVKMDKADLLEAERRYPMKKDEFKESNLDYDGLESDCFERIEEETADDILPNLKTAFVLSVQAIERWLDNVTEIWSDNNQKVLMREECGDHWWWMSEYEYGKLTNESKIQKYED